MFNKNKRALSDYELNNAKKVADSQDNVCNVLLKRVILIGVIDLFRFILKLLSNNAQTNVFIAEKLSPKLVQFYKNKIESYERFIAHHKQCIVTLSSSVKEINDILEKNSDQ